MPILLPFASGPRAPRSPSELVPLTFVLKSIGIWYPQSKKWGTGTPRTPHKLRLYITTASKLHFGGFPYIH